MRDVKVYIFNKKIINISSCPVGAHKKKTKRKRKLIRNFFYLL